MTTSEFDIAIIGSGPGGYVAAVRAAQLGFKTAVIEKDTRVGGTCLTVGCIPSKAILQSTEHYSFIQKHAKEHGIDVGNVKVDFPAIMKRKEEAVKSLTDGVANLFKRHKIEWVQGVGKLTGTNQIQVTSDKGGRVIKAKNIILAAGSSPIGLPFLPFDEKTILSSTGALALEKVPNKMVVVGGGYIGVELASAYSRLGTEVTVVEMLDQICITLDQTIRKELLKILKKQGLTFFLSTKVVKAQKNGKQQTLIITHEGQEMALEADVVLVAIGRRPASKDLGLESVGIQPTDRGFIPVNGQFRTSVANIYAIGDLIDGPMLAHKASEEGIAAVDIIAGKKAHINYMAIPGIVYTSPEAAGVGLTEEEAQQGGLALLIGQCQFKANPRARAVGEMDGLVKVIGEARTGRLIGMHILGIYASEMIHEGMLAIEKKATLRDLAYSPHGHPTFSEAIKEAAQAALGESIHLS